MSYETDYDAAYTDYIRNPNWSDVVENVDYDLLTQTLLVMHSIAINSALPDFARVSVMRTGLINLLEKAAHIHAERVVNERSASFAPNNGKRIN